MKELFWDGEMDCGWEDLSQLIVSTCNRFTDIMLKTTEINPNIESTKMISTRCMSRFGNIVTILADIVKQGIYYSYEDIIEDSQNALKLNGWILLGTLTETILQMFLAFYIDDYESVNWQQWQNFEVLKVQKPIMEYINGMVAEKLLSVEQADSLKKAIKKKIREHTEEHPVQTIMFDELIQLYRYLKLFDEDEIFYLETIKSNRNGIHSFKERSIGNWNDFQYSFRFFCYLMEWVMNRLPDLPDEY